MIEFRVSRTIAAPPEEVWKVLARFAEIWKWSPVVARSVGIGEREAGVGAGRACEIPGFGQIEETVNAWQDGRGLAYDWQASGPVKEGLSRWSLSAEGAGTRVDVVIEATMRFGFVGELLGRLVLEPRMSQLISDSLAGLDHYVTTGEEVGDRVPVAA